VMLPLGVNGIADLSFSWPASDSNPLPVDLEPFPANCRTEWAGDLPRSYWYATMRDAADRGIEVHGALGTLLVTANGSNARSEGFLADNAVSRVVSTSDSEVPSPIGLSMGLACLG